MKLLVNGKEETVSHMGETLGDLLLHIEKEGVPQGNVVRSIKLMGKNPLLIHPRLRRHHYQKSQP